MKWQNSLQYLSLYVGPPIFASCMRGRKKGPANKIATEREFHTKKRFISRKGRRREKRRKEDEGIFRVRGSFSGHFFYLFREEKE